VILLLWLGACAGGTSDTEKPVDTEDTPACTPDPAYNWDTFGAGFVAGRCQGCHGSASTDRHGAPDAVTFDNERQVVQQADAFLRTVLEEASMPPGGGLTDLEKERLAAWLACP
jgi:uncharacterized membrane protein